MNEFMAVSLNHGLRITDYKIRTGEMYGIFFLRTPQDHGGKMDVSLSITFLK